MTKYTRIVLVDFVYTYSFNLLIHIILFALLETVFHVADIFSDFGCSIYSTYSLLFFPSTIDVIFFFIVCYVYLPIM